MLQTMGLGNDLAKGQPNTNTKPFEENPAQALISEIRRPIFAVPGRG